MQQTILTLVEKLFILSIIKPLQVLNALCKVKTAIVQPRQVLEQYRDDLLALVLVPAIVAKALADFLQQSALVDYLFVDLFVVDHLAQVFYKRYQLNDVIVCCVLGFIYNLRQDMHVFQEAICQCLLEWTFAGGYLEALAWVFF